ncbi:unnamed protein product [Prorocentrum cordatum]|uniref:Uncharacterized protein n=1 Tax=Prorocentrum cordatum TaxID=2364126 RepID=A0ABN9TR59_9DINO|nr:unnamed protein product [Polarella glacialis]
MASPRGVQLWSRIYGGSSGSLGWIPLSEGSERECDAEVGTMSVGWAGHARILQDPKERHLLIPRPIEDKGDDGGGRRARHVYVFQEHRLLDEAWAGVTGSMKACGYQIGGTTAVPTIGREGEPGTSAGVGFAVPKDMGMAFPCGQAKWDVSPKGSAGRAAVAWIAAGRGGMLIATVYLWAAVVEIMESPGMPWVMGGDVQNSLGVLAEVKAIKQAETMLVAPTTVVKIVVQEGWPSAPRKPVGLTLDASVQVKRTRTLQKPKDLDDVIIGCAPEPPSCDKAGSFDSVGTAAKSWGHFMQKLEREVKQGGCNLPKPTGAALWWRWLARTLGNLKGAYDRLHSKTVNAGPIAQRLVDVLAQERLFNLSGTARNVRVVDQADRELWAARCQVMAEGLWRGAEKQHILKALLEEARAKSKRFDQELVNERRKGWAAKLESAVKGAAGGLHRLCKPAEVWRPRRAATAAQSADLLQAAQYALDEWNKAWRVGEELNDFNDGDFERLRKVACSFMKRTEIGSDRWHPSMLQGASDDAHWALLAILANELVDRAIGLLPTLVRVWEIMREPYLQAWARENHRSWDCTSYGRAAEDAAWEVILAHEAGAPGDADPAVIATITAILDLAKAFERVCLHVLWGRGKRMRFHAGSLAVVCSCFAMARRVSAGGAVSLETRAVCTIIAGSKFSVGFLKMVIQDTVDGLVVEHPPATWRMHADDLSIRQRGAQQWVADVFPLAIDDSIASFADLGLEFSVGAKGKGAAMANTKWLRDAVQGDMSQGGLPVARACPYLGVDMVSSGAALKAKSGKRFARMRRRTARLLQLRGAKSLTLQLALAKEGPTCEITAAPAVRWSRAARELTAGEEAARAAQWEAQQGQVPEADVQALTHPHTNGTVLAGNGAVGDVAALDEALGVWAALWITDLCGVDYQDVDDWLEWVTVLVGVRYEGATQADIVATCKRSRARARWWRAAAIRYINDLDYVDRVEVLKQCRYERGAAQQELRRLLGDRLRRAPDDGVRQLEAGSGCHNIGSLGDLLDLFVQVGRQLAISEERVSGRRRELSEREDLREQLQRAWKQQQSAVGMQPQWGRVKGPAGAVIMSIRRAGWKWPEWHLFLMRNGEQLNLLETCPNDVGMLLQQDLEAQLWAQWTAEPGHESLAPAPFLQPAKAVLGARNFPKHAKNAARKVLISDS